MNQTIAAWSYVQRKQVRGRLLVFHDADHWVMNGNEARYYWDEVHAWLADYLCEKILANRASTEANEGLAKEITLLAGQINAANCRLLKLIAEFDDNKGWHCDHSVKSCAHWLNWRCGIATGSAREKLHVDRCVSTLPRINS